MRLDRLANYEQEHANFRWNPPETFNFSSDVVDDWAARRPDLEALIWVGEDGVTEERFTYADIAAQSQALAAQFAEAGVQKGDRVIVMLPRVPSWQLTMVGLMRIGAVPIPCITMLTPYDLSFRLEHSGAAAVVTTAAEAHKFAGIADSLLRFSVEETPGWEQLAPTTGTTIAPATIGQDDPTILYYTSGSTGMPKGVLHSGSSIFAWRTSGEYWLSLDEGDVIWCTADTGWSKAGTSILFGPWTRGATVVFHDGPFDVARRFELIERHRVVCYCAAATELRRLIQQFDHTADLSALQLTVSAGEAVDPETVVRWRELSGSITLDGYGQTETLMTVTNATGMEVKPGSMGRPLPGVETALLDVDGNVVHGPGHGELLIGAPSPALMIEYYKDPERTRACYVEVDGKTWFRTGDLVDVDADGYVTYAGRADDIISSSGYRIGPTEVENVLMTHDAVLEAAVVGLPDASRGELVTAFVVLSESGNAAREADEAALIAELQRHVRTVTAPYKYPRAVYFVDDLPKTPTGKVRRVVLRTEGAPK